MRGQWLRRRESRPPAGANGPVAEGTGHAPTKPCKPAPRYLGSLSVRHPPIALPTCFNFEGSTIRCYRLPRSVFPGMAKLKQKLSRGDVSPGRQRDGPLAETGNCTDQALAATRLARAIGRLAVCRRRPSLSLLRVFA